MRSWQFDTIVILGLLILSFMLVGALIGLVFGFLFQGLTWANGALAMLVVALFVAAYCYLSPVDPVLKGMNAEQVSESSCPRVYNIVKRLAEKANTPMPLVYVCDVDYPNAFALGRSPDKALVAVTKPLMDLLTDDELEGVMGHELSHIIHRDTIVNGIARTSASVLTYFSLFMGFAALLSALVLGSAGSSSGGGNGGLILFLILLAVLIPVIIVGAILYIAVPGSSAILNFGVSRSREYGADESSARLTRKPMSLANALVKIDKCCAGTDNDYKTKTAIAAPIMITNPFGNKREKLTNRLFSSHPSTESRVERLKQIDAELRASDRSSYLPQSTSSR